MVTDRCDAEVDEGPLLHIPSMGTHVQCMSEGRKNFPPDTVYRQPRKYLCISNYRMEITKYKTLIFGGTLLAKTTKDYASHRAG